ncbi:disintegrin and metalloproteinase domain-containing protein 1a-like [Antechinus flavipes]|uniref:disintegrin and metalloproteinase domain-containing protein 1a-like n=1 Tax=Antechinus flavipes TaxID=38775 RepID=UPI0022357338|nr:disintegrin and metalloproteinase domain-containing protein 1a-like [Antechinus flavipes]
MSPIPERSQVMDERRKKYPFKGPQISLGLCSSIIGLEIIFLWVGILLPGTCCAQEHYSYYEIVIPKKLVTFKSKEQSTEKLSYMLLMRGKRHVIQLRLKRGLFLKDFPVYTYTQEALDLNVPFIQDDCFYDGYVEGELRSLVSVSTCSGLRGMIAVEKLVYGIEPIGTSKEFEHVVYYMDGHVRGSCKVSGENTPKSPDTLYPIANEDYSHGEEEPVKSVNYIWSHTKYLELFLVVDNRRFLMWNSNVTTAVRTVMDALAHVNTYSRALRVRVVLVGLEIWTERDRVRVSGDLGEVLRAFNRWREGELAGRARHDAAHLIVGSDPGERAGAAFLGGACVPGRAAGVEAFSHEDPAAFAALLAHELGHNLGMRHDHAACLCPDRPSCLMGDPVSLQGSFSNCSLGDLYAFVRPPHGSCLYDKPAARPVPRKPRCGDGVVDAGEECDCGDPGACPEEACCLPSCQRRPGSACASGPCCSECRLLEAATPCRPSVDECDLPEYCDGASPRCPPDSYKQDGAPCRAEGRCYRGRCRSLRSQCEALFGAGSRAAPPSCYRHLNTRGDRFGNCGRGQPGLLQAFVGCEPQHVLCGKLLCEHVRRLPRMRKHHTLIQVPLGDAWCWAADLFEEAAEPEGGAVQAGTWCGPRQVCVNHTCSDVGGPRAECEPGTTCHGRGVCNNLQHCHCDAGYAPPACEAEGPGGSVDSGPPPEDHIVTLAVRVPMSTKNLPPTHAVRSAAPGAVTPGAKSDTYEGSESPLLSLSPTFESALPYPLANHG